jgi:ParB-like chromosome segregation protein Spo0J
LVDGGEVIIAGHARWLAARKLGMEEVPVIVLRHLTPAQRRALVIADNQLAIAGAGWDETMLRVELEALRNADYELDLIGFDDVELARFLNQQDAAEGLTDEDAAPELPFVPVSRNGDLWILGGHVKCPHCGTVNDV